MKQKAVTARQYRLFGSIGLLLSTSWLAHANSTTGGLEGWLFNTIYVWPDWLRPIMLAITQLGSAWTICMLAVVLGLIRHYRLGLRLMLTAATAYGMVEALKLIVQRPRPFLVLTGVTDRELLTGGYGFPSGHTALATVAGFMLLPLIPKAYRWVVLLLIALVGISRIYLGVHAPLDIVGGFACGLLVVSLQAYIRRLLPGVKAR